MMVGKMEVSNKSAGGNSGNLCKSVLQKPHIHVPHDEQRYLIAMNNALHIMHVALLHAMHLLKVAPAATDHSFMVSRSPSQC